MLLYHCYLIPLAVSAIASLKSFRLAWPVPYRAFSVFLFATLLVELFASLWSYGLYHRFGVNYTPNNVWIYNGYLIPQYVFYIYFFSKNIKGGAVRKLALVLAVCYVLAVTCSLFLFGNLLKVDGVTIAGSSLIVVYFSALYFIQLMRSDTVVKIARQPIFWIASGTFIFHLGSLPCFMLFKYISRADAVLATSLFRIIVILNFILYTAYAIAFVCTKRFPKPPS